MANELLDFLLDSKTGTKERESKRLLVLGPSQNELQQFICYLKANFNLDTESINLTNGGLNYTCLFQKEDEDSNTFDLNMLKQIKLLELYSIGDPLPNSSADLNKLISTLSADLEETHLLYMLNTMSDQTSNFPLIGQLFKERNIDYSQLFELLESVFSPITKLRFKSVNILICNVNSWIYDSITMPYVDFCQQIIRSAFIESINDGKLIYTDKELDFDNLRADVTNVIESILYDMAPSSNDCTVLSKYSNLTIDSKFDTVTRIKHLDETFDWEGQWRRQWIRDGTVENNTQATPPVSIKTESIKDYFNTRIQQLAKIQAKKSLSNPNN